MNLPLPVTTVPMIALPGAEMKSLSGVTSDESVTEKGDQGKGDGVVSHLSKNMLVISGGEGYIDFRIGNEIISLNFQRCHAPMMSLSCPHS